MRSILKHESRCRLTLELSFEVGQFTFEDFTLIACVGCMCVGGAVVQQKKLPSNETKHIPQCSQKIKI